MSRLGFLFFLISVSVFLAVSLTWQEEQRHRKPPVPSLTADLSGHLDCMDKSTRKMGILVKRQSDSEVVSVNICKAAEDNSLLFETKTVTP